MTRVEGENCRLRLTLARLHRSFPMLFQIRRDVKNFSTVADLLSPASPNSSISLNHSVLGNAVSSTRNGGGQAVFRLDADITVGNADNALSAASLMLLAIFIQFWG